MHHLNVLDEKPEWFQNVKEKLLELKKESYSFTFGQSIPLRLVEHFDKEAKTIANTEIYLNEDGMDRDVIEYGH